MKNKTNLNFLEKRKFTIKYHKKESARCFLNDMKKQRDEAKKATEDAGMIWHQSIDKTIDTLEKELKNI